MMKHLILCLVLCFNTMYGDDPKSYKASELELFLFKIGFEALQNDVKSNSEKTKLNEEDIVDLKNKISLIMDKVYKDELSLEKNDKHYDSNTEIKQLQEEISFLKKQIANLQGVKTKQKATFSKEKIDTIEVAEQSFSAFINVNFASVREIPSSSATVIKTIPRNTVIEIEKCDSFGWCKILNKNEYIAHYVFKNMLQ